MESCVVGAVDMFYKCQLVSLLDNVHILYPYQFYLLILSITLNLLTMNFSVHNYKNESLSLIIFFALKSFDSNTATPAFN